MPQNGINHPGVTALAQAFAINPLLRVINLNDNTFTEKGAVAMAKVRRVQQGQVRPWQVASGSCLCQEPISQWLLYPPSRPPVGPAV